MNNEIGRKITSLTLMTIMLAGGMVIAAPSMVPEAHAANANLFVSAENSAFDNYMSGPQVIEVVVIDSDISDTDQAKGEPDVTVNGKILRMAQAVDGNWYGYFADVAQAQIADSTVNVAANGTSLDFGTFCTNTSGTNVLGFSTADTLGIAIPTANANTTLGGVGSSTGAAITATCTGATLGWQDTTDLTPEVNGTAGSAMNVIREAKAINSGAGISSVNPGQIGFNAESTGGDFDGVWPFIQLYSLSAGGNVVVQYNKAGGAQSTTLTFDTVEGYASAALDRSVYPQSSQVHVTITDLWLNIDPTDEDSWTFGTNATNSTSYGTYYQVFNEDGTAAGGATAKAVTNIKATLSDLMVETNAVLKVNANAQSAANNVLTVQDNGDSMITCTTANSANTCITDGAATTGNLGENTVPITLTETGPNTGVFGSYDESDESSIKITTNAARGTSGTIDYNDEAVTVLAGFDFGTISMDITDDEWNSGEEIPITLVDADANKNSRADEDLDLNDSNVSVIPSLITGDPFTLGEKNDDSTETYNMLYIPATNTIVSTCTAAMCDLTVMTSAANTTDTATVAKFSERAESDVTNVAAIDAIAIDLEVTAADLKETLMNTRTDATTRLNGFNLLNTDLRSFSTTGTFDVYILNATTGTSVIDGAALGNQIGTGGTNGTVNAIGPLGDDIDPQSLTVMNGTTAYDSVLDTIYDMTDTDNIGVLYVPSAAVTAGANERFVTDIFSFGFTNSGVEDAERISNQIIRFELEESGDNTNTFVGSLEYVMVNQLNILTSATYSGLTTISDETTFIVISDLTDEDAPRINYLDLGADGVSTQIADQVEAPSHSGVVSLDADNYKEADTVTITLEDLDLNTDSSLIDIYTVVTTNGDSNEDAVGSATVANSGTSIALADGSQLGRMLDVTIDDARWTDGACAFTAGVDQALGDTGFTLVETGVDSGVFTGDFQIPAEYCASGATAVATPTGKDLEVNYVDFRDASGATIEVGDGAGIRANSGSVSLDRTVYPVPFGVESDFAAQGTTGTPNGRALFPIHQTGTGTDGLQTGEFIANGDLTIHVRVNDPDFDISASGEDSIASDTAAAAVGPVKVSVIRGSSTNVLTYAGGPVAQTGLIDTDASTDQTTVPEAGPMLEIAPDAGIFEADITIRYTDGPQSTSCPSVTDEWTATDGGTTTGEGDRFDAVATSGDYCILQGDILQVEYTDPADASGNVNTVTDSATFDLRNGVLQSDKSVYIIGSDMILTLIEPDFDLDNDSAETYDLDLIEWDDGDSSITMGNKGDTAGVFDPEPSDFRETGDSTGIFQIVIEIPATIGTNSLDRGQQIDMEYTDWGPSGSDFVGDEDEDMNATVYTSNFGATVELDQKVYTWTDKVYITIVAPDHNFDSSLIDSVGESTGDIIKVSTRSYNIKQYKLVETGTDTGIFTGEVILTGFSHDADGDLTTGTANNGYDVTPATTSTTGQGPTNGQIQTDNEDGLTVSFEYTEDETVVGSALIRWNIGEVQWLEASYPASGTGVVRIIDPDMNWDPEAVDNFAVDLWSDSDAGGIDLTVTETNEATGIFEGTVFFTTTDESSGHRLRVAEGDTVTAEYEDNTLPAPYTTADELDVTATSLIGTVVPPLERAPAANLRTVDAFGNSLDAVSVDQQVQLTADLANGQDNEQSFAYLVQIQNDEGVTVSLAWITGSLSSGQSFSPALSWIPTEAGSYTATAFVWESVDNPTALSPPVSTTVNVR